MALLLDEIDASSKDQDLVKELKKDILAVRNNICNAFLIVFAIVLIPAFFASLSRIPQIGWQPVMALHTVLVIITCLMALLRQHISYVYKAGYIILLFSLIGVSGLIQFGLIAGSIVFIVFSGAISTLLFGGRIGAIILMVNIICLIVVAYLTVSGQIGPNFDLNDYNAALSSWLTLIIGTFLLSGALISSIFIFNKSLIKAMQVSRQHEIDLKQHKKNLENIVEERTRDLKRSNADLERCAQVIAHDLKSPLNSISGHAQILSAFHDDVPERMKKYLKDIVDRSIDMSEIIDEVFRQTKINKEQVYLLDQDLNKILDKVKKQLVYEIEKSNCIITSDKLPVLKVSEIQFVRLFQNLISNAIKYRSPDRRLLIHISSECKEGRCIISVRDNAMGIEEEQQTLVFSMYHQAHQTDDVADGVGLGLASCKNIVDQHDGEIWLESVQGEGSVFYIAIKQ